MTRSHQSYSRRPFGAARAAHFCDKKIARPAAFKFNEIARPQFTSVPPLSITRIDGEPAVLLRILRQPGTNSLRVADAVYAKLEELKKSFPRDLRLLKAPDETARMREDLRDLAIRSCFSLLVVLLVLLLFLRSWSSALVVMATIFFAVLRR